MSTNTTRSMNCIARRMRVVAEYAEIDRRAGGTENAVKWECNLAGLEYALDVVRDYARPASVWDAEKSSHAPSVEAGEGWRFLKVGEIIARGDEFMDWEKADFSVGCAWNGAEPFRRRIVQTEAKQETAEKSSQLPTPTPVLPDESAEQEMRLAMIVERDEFSDALDHANYELERLRKERDELLHKLRTGNYER